MSSPLKVRWTDDPAAYLDRVEQFLTAHPVEHSVLLTTAHRSVAAPVTDSVWMWVELDGRVVAAAQHTPPHGAYVSLAPAAASEALAAGFVDLQRALPGVGGMRADSEAFGCAWRQLTGTEVSEALARGVYVAAAVRHPKGVPGRLRPAVPTDADLVQSWSDAFHAELAAQHLPSVDVRPRVAQGVVSLWDLGGQPVSVAMVSPAYGGVCRVSLVYTPPEQRRRGYAGACVAALTEQELLAGNRCMLYTDLANPTSNGVYQRIGYERVRESVDLRFSVTG